MRSVVAMMLGLGVSGCVLDTGSFSSGSSEASGSSSGEPHSGTTQGSGTTEGPSADSTSLGSTSTGEPSAESTTSEEPTGTSTGSELPGLEDMGLLARWYLDDAGMDQPRIMLADAVDPPLDLMPDYVGDSPSFIELDGHRGLRWTTVEVEGSAQAPIGGTKFETSLHGSHQATFELVLGVNDVTDQTSRFLVIAKGNDGGDISIGSDDINALQIRWQNTISRTFHADLGSKRQTIHVVLDTDRPVPDDRITAFRNGAPLPLAGNLDSLPGPGDPITLDLGGSLTLGNRTQGPRSFAGQLYYAAVYSMALTPAQIQHNAALLQQSDDSP